jgi:hypothetical protein
MDDEPPAAKRPRIRLACQECRDRKIRCDGARPTCHSCVRKKLGPERCIYTIPDSESSYEYVRSLENRIRELEHNVPQSIIPTSLLPVARTSDHGQQPRIPSEEPSATSQYHPLYNASTRSSEIYSAPQLGLRATGPRSHLVAFETVPTAYHGTETRSPRVERGTPSTNSPLSASWRPRAPDGPRRGSPGTSRQGQSPATQRATAETEPIEILQMNRTGSDIMYLPERNPMGTEGLVEEGSNTNDGSSVYLGRSSAAAFLSEIRGSNLKDGPVEESGWPVAQNGDPVVVSPDSNSSRARSRQSEHALARLMEELVLPPRLVADKLLENYWNYFWPFNPALHRPTFQRR